MHLHPWRTTAAILTVLCSALVAIADAPPAPPEGFPHFVVPGAEAPLASLRALYWEQYLRGGPKATLWDEWLPEPTLWPAVADDDRMNDLRRQWRAALCGRQMDAEGYVATHQHPSIAHQQGWPFPFWGPGNAGSWGWHFSLAGVPQGWHQATVQTQEGWTILHGDDAGVSDAGWTVTLSAPQTAIQPPPVKIEVLQAPFMQLRWRARGLGADAQPYLEWTTANAPDFSPQRRMYFDPVESDAFAATMIPVYRHPLWKGQITGLRIQFGNHIPGGTAVIQALFTQYDTRHNINNPAFIKGASQYFCWTHDVGFLRDQIQRLRLALRYLMTECGGLKEDCIATPFVGHCGRSGLLRAADGTKQILPGRGIGNNYWDLLPFGRRDAYATMYYYDALLHLAALERAIAAHPAWDIPGGPLRLDPEELEQHAREVQAANSAFWNAATGRFTLGIDDDGAQHDYGFTFMNLEAVYYDYASPVQAASIMGWITGQREVPGDTSHGLDIYHWRFAPRSTTLRNIEYYGWFWNAPESIPWGGQVQDGGAVLGFSYHDLMARLKVLGSDNAWARLKEIIAWYDEVQAAGGPRKYYEGGQRGTLQGCNTPGGLGVDCEFFESILVPQVMLRGFLGLTATPTGFQLAPQLPSDWPELTVDRIHMQERIVNARVTRDLIELTCASGRADYPIEIDLPAGAWTVAITGDDGSVVRERAPAKRNAPCPIGAEWASATTLRFAREAP